MILEKVPDIPPKKIPGSMKRFPSSYKGSWIPEKVPVFMDMFFGSETHPEHVHLCIQNHTQTVQHQIEVNIVILYAAKHCG